MGNKNISEKKVSIIYITTGLSTGGAERMLYNLLSRINRERFSPVVVSLMDRGTWGDRIEALGIPVYIMGMKQGKPTPKSIWQFIHQIRQLKPDLILGWMYHANLAAQLAGIFTLKSIPVVWNIRHSIYSLDYEKPATSAIIKILAKISSFPEKILYNSKTGASQHEQLGYQASKTLVISNGFDPENFMPSLEFRTSLIKELGLESDTFLIGRFARYHLMKDFANFLEAAAILLKDYPDVHFLLAGDEVNWENQILSQLIHELKIVDRIHLLGDRQDIPRLTAALDIASSSSFYGEAFPNVIGEAMSCGVPCVVTDVGDSAWIVSNTGRIVSPKNPKALADAWKELIKVGLEGRNALGKAARTRIIENFSLDSIVAQYEELYESVLIKKK
ncbi:MULTISPECIES: glycosyltransferase [unclassified Microcoleus]|uniref:glycosyltransferase family 4 protein n=1 Tax=unclassified Microcoleus TaxID=2642155 RepID=UPI002FD29412